MDYRDSAKRLKGLQVDKGLKTQKALAEWLDVSTSIVCDWLNGDKLPSMDTAIRLAEKFDCSLDWLMTGRGTRNPDRTTIYDMTNLIDVSHLTHEQRSTLSLFLSTLAP